MFKNLKKSFEVNFRNIINKIYTTFFEIDFKINFSKCHLKTYFV